MKRLPAKRDEPPSRPITFRAAEDLGALELARLWADGSAWALTNRTQYDELAELAVMSALAAWLRRWQPIAIHGAILAGARPEAVAGAFGDSVEVAFERWREWAVIQRDNIIGSKPGIDAEEYDTVARRFTARPGPAPRLYPAEPGTGPGHQLIEYPRPAARVYAGASGQQKIIMSRHKPGSSAGGRRPPAPGPKIYGPRGRQGCINHFQPWPARHPPAISRPGGHMRRGEVWWAEFAERRPVVLLSEEEPSGFRAMWVVAPADTDISGLGVEVAVGVPEGLPFEGVLRFGFPWPGFTPCTWLTTLSRDDLIERAGAVSAAKLSEIDDALRAIEQTTEWTPAAAARLGEIKDSLRRQTQADGEGTDPHADEGRSRPHDRRSVAPQQQDHDLGLEY